MRNSLWHQASLRTLSSLLGIRLCSFSCMSSRHRLHTHRSQVAAPEPLPRGPEPQPAVLALPLSIHLQGQAVYSKAFPLIPASHTPPSLRPNGALSSSLSFGLPLHFGVLIMLLPHGLSQFLAKVPALLVEPGASCVRDPHLCSLHGYTWLTKCYKGRPRYFPVNT